MSLFKRLLGQQTAGDSLTVAQQELLMRLTVQPTNDYLRAVWEPIVGPLERNISRFVREGLLEDATSAGKLAATHGVEGLKALLRQYSVTPRGRKLELAELAAASLPANEVQRLTAGVRLYRPTAQGQAIITGHQEDVRLAHGSMQQDAVTLLKNGDVRAATARVGAYERAYHFLAWDSSGMFSLEPEPEAVAYVLHLSFDDLKADPDKRCEVGAWLALSLLGGQRYDQLGTVLVGLLGGTFTCAPLEEFLRTSPSRLHIGHVDPGNPMHVAQLYASTRLAEAVSTATLKRLVKSHTGRGVKMVSQRDNECTDCTHASRSYTWRDVGSIPKVPLHWGCRCAYSPWVD